MLILANAAVFWFELRIGESALENFIFTWGLVPAQFLSAPVDGWLTIFTSMFLHGGWFHLLSNMWVLYIFGDNIEDRVGAAPYLFFYLLSGAAAALLQTYITQGSSVPMIGASGAIAGVLGASYFLPWRADCQPCAYFFHLHHCRCAGCAIPHILVRIPVVFRVVRHSGRQRQWDRLVGAYWGIYFRLDYGIFLWKKDCISKVLENSCHFNVL
jgi:hypothetical protein